MKMHTNRHQEAKLLPPDTFLSRKNAFAAGAPDPAGGAYSAPPDPPAGNGGGAPGKGDGKWKRGRGGEGWGEEGSSGVGRSWKGRRRAIPPNENPGYGLVKGFKNPKRGGVVRRFPAKMAKL